MKIFSKAVLSLAAGVLVALGPGTQAMAATNDAIDGGTTSLTLNPSGLVTVNAATITLIKQVYDMAGTCLASDASATLPADDCGPDTITVASGTPLQFLIYVRNTSSVALTDVRFVDDINDAAGALGGFTYTPVVPAGDIEITPIAGMPLDTATADQIYTAASGGTLQTDAVGGPDDFVSVTDAGDQANLDYVTVGAVAGQANLTLDIPANSTFAVLIPVTKN